MIVAAGADSFERASEGVSLVARGPGGGAPRTIADGVESAASRGVFEAPLTYPATYAPIASATANAIVVTGTPDRRAVDGAGRRCGAASTRRATCAASRSRASAISRSSGQMRTSSGLNGSASSWSTHVRSLSGPRSLPLAHGLRPGKHRRRPGLDPSRRLPRESGLRPPTTLACTVCARICRCAYPKWGRK